MRKIISRLAVFLLILCTAAGPALSCPAADQPEWTNEETGYRAVVADEADLLTASEEDRLLERLEYHIHNQEK